jgi:cbb3-type cytochrome oxidase subunit 3
MSSSDMEKSIKRGALCIYSSKFNNNTTDVDDVIVYHIDENSTKIKRIIDKETNQKNNQTTKFVLRGDNETIYTEIENKDITIDGKYLFSMPILGYYLELLKKIQGKLIVFTFVFVCFLLHVYSISGKKVFIKKKNNRLNDVLNNKKDIRP